MDGSVKVGDKVRSLVTQMDVEEGKEYVAIRVNGDGTVHVVDDAGDPYSLYGNEYELVTNPEFKVGDRVRLIKDGISTTGAIGKLATIASWGGTVMDRGEYLIKIDAPVDYKTRSVAPEYTRVKPDAIILANELKIEDGKYYKTRDGRKVGPMEAGRHGGYFDSRRTYTGYGWHENGLYIQGTTCKLDLIAEWVDEPATAKRYSSCAAAQVDVQREEYGGGYAYYPWQNPAPSAHHSAIVALIEDDQPKPSQRPFVHSSREAAEREAKRLANKHTGKEFGVYELVGTVKEAKQYNRRWKRLAADGLDESAASELSELAGLSRDVAHSAVLKWQQENA